VTRALPRLPQVYGWLGVEPPRGVLLHGPPGCGKTALANAIANECGVPFLRVSAPEVVSGMSGESEAKIRQLFQEAAALAPCIVFIGAAAAAATKSAPAASQMRDVGLTASGGALVGGSCTNPCAPTRCSWKSLIEPRRPSPFPQTKSTQLRPSARRRSARWSAASWPRC
jgi:DNA polymerase III delta prime subunit